MSSLKPTKQLMLVMPADLVAWLDELARDNSVSRTWLIRQVLAGYRDALEAENRAEASRPEPTHGLAAVKPRRSSPHGVGDRA